MTGEKASVAQTQREDMWRRPSTSHRRDLGRNQRCQHLELRLLPARPVRKWTSSGKTTQSVAFRDGSPHQTPPRSPRQRAVILTSSRRRPPCFLCQMPREWREGCGSSLKAEEKTVAYRRRYWTLKRTSVSHLSCQSRGRKETTSKVSEGTNAYELRIEGREDTGKIWNKRFFSPI